MRKLLALVGAIFLLALEAQAQFIGYVSPQTVQQTLASGVSCTGGAQIFNINNLGQTQHYLSLSNLTNVTNLQAYLRGVDSQGNNYTISDVLDGANGTSATVRGSGYYPQVQAVITCQGTLANFTASYSGAWATFDVDAGSYLNAQIDKVDWHAASESANQTDSFNTPFGSSAGTLYFEYSVAGAGGSITVSCGGNIFTAPNNAVLFSANLANTTNEQVFQIPDAACPVVYIKYLTNGTTGLISGEYVFAQPGSFRPAFQYSHITGTTATAIKGTPGFLHNVIINTGASGTISLFDLASANCTGTPSTNTVAVITATTSTVVALPYDENFLNGICAKASAVMDFTASYQ